MFNKQAAVRAITRAGLMLACAFTLGNITIQAQTPRWSQPTPLNDYWEADSGADERYQSLATDGEDTWVMTWHSNVNGSELLAARSTDDGATWSSPALVSDTRVGYPTGIVYAGDGVWVAQWIYLVRDFTGWIYFAETYSSRSLDGLTWDEPRYLGINRYLANYGDTDSDNAGTIITAADDQIYRSIDSGQTWTSTTIQTGTSTSLLSRQVAYAGGNKWYAVGSTYETGNQLYTSLDGGQTWSAPKALPFPDADLNDMAARGDTVAIATGRTVYVSQSPSFELDSWVSIPIGIRDLYHQSLAVDADGNWAIVTGPGALTIRRSSNPTADWTPEVPVSSEPDTSQEHPHVVPGGGGNWAIAYNVLATITNRPGPDSDVKITRSANEGASWSAPEYINEGAADDLPQINDRHVQLVSGDNGDVVAAWAAATGGNYDFIHVMFARSEDYGATWSNAAPATPAYGTHPVLFESFELDYAGHGRWMISWEPGVLPFTGDYVISNDNAFTWSAPETFYGYTAAGSGNGTLIKANNGFGDPLRYGLARLPQGAQYWEEPTYIEEANFQVIVHSSGENWFAITDDLQTYVSGDDGRTWSQAVGNNTPPADSKISTDHNGTVVAMYADSDVPISSQVAPIYTTRSFNNGVNWSPPVLLTTVKLNGLLSPGFYGSWGDISPAGPGTWVAVWSRRYHDDTWDYTLTEKLEYVISRDNGVTWSQPLRTNPAEQINDLTTQVGPNVAGADGKMVVGYASLSGDGDVFTSFGLLNPPTAARDWQLFE